MSGEKIFVDTNVLVYGYDRSAGEKHEIAKNLLLSLWESGNGMLSTQVLAEFFVTVTRKIPKPLKTGQASKIVEDYITWDPIILDGGDILKAIEIGEKRGFSFWDALIIASAIKGGAETLLTEDLSDGEVVDAVRIVNPFAER